MFSASSGSRSNSISVDQNETDLIEIIESEKPKPKKVHFYVYCPTCNDLKQGRFCAPYFLINNITFFLR